MEVSQVNARPRRYWLHSRETILLLCVFGLVIGFAVTGFAARLYHGRRAELARSWFDRGSSELREGRADLAVSDLRTALVYAQHELPAEQQQQYELQLAQALVATGNSDEAKSYLNDLWGRTPGNSRVNLELARLAAHTGDEASAKRYYNGAIYGVWDEPAVEVLRSRMDTRLELFRYLMDRGEKTEAQGMLLATAAEIPPDPKLQVLVGQLMLQSGQPQQALGEFEAALKLDARNYEALAGAGEASFQLQNDRDAVRYLGGAAREGSLKRRGGDAADSAARQSQQAEVTRDLAIAQATLALDPNRTGLGPEERSARAIRSYDAAETRIKACAAGNAGVTAPQPSAKLAPLTHAASDDRAQAMLAVRIEELEPLMELTFETESAATASCGAPSDPTNAAIVRIAARTQAAHP